MNPDYTDPTDPRALALRFADPAYRAEWSPGDRPAWPGVMPSEAFRQWTGDRLLELEALVGEEMEREMSAALTPEHLARMAEALRGPDWQGFVQRADDAIRELDGKGEKPTRHAIENKIKRMAEPKRRGRTRSPSNPVHEVATAAAWDVWKLRRVILPRFWPEEASGEFHLDKMELAKVAAHRRNCTPKEANRQYMDLRIAGA